MTEQRKYRDLAFARDALIADLHKLDGALTKPVHLIVIGGSALAAATVPALPCNYEDRSIR